MIHTTQHKPVFKQVMIILASIQTLTWFFIVWKHTIFEEWDGVMQFYSGQTLVQTHHYTGWASHFWPPLQPLLLSLGHPLFIGKCVACVSGGISLICLYQIAKILQAKSPLFVVIALYSLSIFTKNFSVVENHALETALYLSSVTLFLYFMRYQVAWYLYASAVTVALACLTRYTSYSLFASMVLYLLYHPNLKRKQKILYSIQYTSITLFILSPWLISNSISNGHPFATWQYLNIGSAVYPGSTAEWWWNIQTHYHGITEIIGDYPLEYLINFVGNLIESMIILLASPWGGYSWSCIISGFILYLIYRTDRQTFKPDLQVHTNSIRFLVFASCFYILLAANAFVFLEALLPIIFIFMVLFLVSVEKNLHHNQYSKYMYYFVVLHMCVSAYHGWKYIDNQRTHNQLYAHQTVYQTIKKQIIKKQINPSTTLSSLPPQVPHTPSLNNPLALKYPHITILSIHPTHAYELKTQWIMAPLAQMKSLCDVIHYRVSDKVFHYAPKSNFDLQASQVQIHYLIITKGLAKVWPFISNDLMIDTNDACFEQVHSLYKDQGVHIVEVLKSSR